MNEWMKYLMDLFYNLILVEISFWKEQENHNNIYSLYKVYAYNKPLVHYLKWISFVFSVQIYSRMHADLSLAWN